MNLISYARKDKLNIPVHKLLKEQTGSDEPLVCYALPLFAKRTIVSKGQTYNLICYLDSDLKILQPFQLVSDGDYKLVTAETEVVEPVCYVRLEDVSHILMFEGWNNLNSYKLSEFYLPSASLNLAKGGLNWGNATLEVPKCGILDINIAQRSELIAEYCRNHLKRVNFQFGVPTEKSKGAKVS